MIVMNSRDDATALVGMFGIVVAVQELVDGEWWLGTESSGWGDTPRSDQAGEVGAAILDKELLHEV